LLDQPGELDHRGLDRRPELEDLATDVVGCHGADDAVAEVLDVDEVARLRAVAEDLEALAAQAAPDEVRDRVVLVERVGAVDVREAERRGLHAERARKSLYVRLARELAGAVGG